MSQAPRSKESLPEDHGSAEADQQQSDVAGSASQAPRSKEPLPEDHGSAEAGQEQPGDAGSASGFSGKEWEKIAINKCYPSELYHRVDGADTPPQVETMFAIIEPEQHNKNSSKLFSKHINSKETINSLLTSILGLPPDFHFETLQKRMETIVNEYLDNGQPASALALLTGVRDKSRLGAHAAKGLTLTFEVITLGGTNFIFSPRREKENTGAKPYPSLIPLCFCPAAAAETAVLHTDELIDCVADVNARLNKEFGVNCRQMAAIWTFLFFSSTDQGRQLVKLSEAKLDYLAWINVGLGHAPGSPMWAHYFKKLKEFWRELEQAGSAEAAKANDRDGSEKGGGAKAAKANDQVGQESFRNSKPKDEPRRDELGPGVPSNDDNDELQPPK